MAVSTKPLATQISEAQGRANSMHVRTLVVPEQEQRQYITLSQSQDDVQYTLTRRRSGWVCSCPGFYYGHICKHLGSLMARAEREDWEFGRVSRTEGVMTPLVDGDIDTETGEILG